MRAEEVAIATLVLDPRNARKHGRRNLEAIKASLARFGQQKPIVVGADGQVIAGNGTVEAAKAMGWTHVSVVRSGLEDHERSAYAIADNRTAELAAWDDAVLATQLAELAAIDLTLVEATGFDAPPDGVQSGERDPDAVPEVPDKATTKPGDLWILGEHRLLCGDSGSVADLDRLLGGEPVQLVNTDPPYNVKVEPRSNNAVAAGLSSFSSEGKATHGKLRAKDRPLENDCVSSEAFNAMLDAWFGNIARVLEPGRCFYTWGGYANCANYPPAFARHELHFAQAIIWHKQHPVIGRKDFMGDHEWCFYGWREGAAHVFLGPDNARDVWRVAPSKRRPGAVSASGPVRIVSEDGCAVRVGPDSGGADDRTIVATGDGVVVRFGTDASTDFWSVKKVSGQSMVHLTEKPVELAVRAMRMSSRVGERVLDLFGGSGSTLIAAEMMKRRAFLMELDPLYCDVIVQRFEEFTGVKATRS